MYCHNIEHRLNRYVDGELGDVESKMVERHLNGCTECSRIFEQYEKVDTILDGLEGLDPPADFTRRVMLAAQKRRNRRAIIDFPTWRKMPVPARVAATVAVCLGMALGGLIGHATHIGSTGMTLEDGYLEMADEFFTTPPADEISDRYLALLDYGE